MKVLVALKQVPARDSLLRADERGWIDESELNFELNEPDAYALEAALRWKEQNGGEVIAMTAGPARSTSALRDALAKGADRAVQIIVENVSGWDPFDVASLLAAAARSEAPDLILTGLQSDDLGAGQTGVLLAELLGLPHATLIMQLELAGGRLRAKRELEGGWFEWREMPLPALLTVQSGSSKLRYATLMGIKKARTKELRTLTPEELGVAPAWAARILRLAPPPRSARTVMLAGPPAAVAAQLVDKLRHEARAL